MRHVLVQDVAIFLRFMAKFLLVWSFTPVSDTTNTIANTNIFTALSL